MKSILTILLCALVGSLFGQGFTLRDSAFVGTAFSSSGYVMTNLFYDNFNDGDINPLDVTRTASPGPGIWSNSWAGDVVQSVSNLYSIDSSTNPLGGVLNWSTTAAPAYASSRLLSGAITNTAGLAFITRVWLTGGTTAGWITAGFGMAGTNKGMSCVVGQSSGLGSWVNSLYQGTYAYADHYESLELAAISRTNGALFFVRGSIRNPTYSDIYSYPNWTLYSVRNATITTNLYPIIDGYNGGYVDNFRAFHLGPEWNDAYYAASARSINPTNDEILSSPLESTVELTFRAGDINSPQDIIRIHQIDANNRYIWRFMTNHLHLVQVVGGTESVKVNISYTITSNSMYRASSTCIGSNVWLEVDGFALQATKYAGIARDPAAMTSSIGVTTGSNFVVWPANFTWPTYANVTTPIGIFVSGDSKTAGSQSILPNGLAVSYSYLLREMMNTNDAITVREIPYNGGHSGATVATLLSTYITNDLSYSTNANMIPDYVLLNIGANDVSTTIDTTLTNNVLSLLDSYHAYWPSTKVYVANIWRTNFANLSTFNSMLNYCVSARPTFCYTGIDENVFLPANTYDGVHATRAGDILAAKAWKALVFP
jgi:lysophospholipase L1-like esterase